MIQKLHLNKRNKETGENYTETIVGKSETVQSSKYIYYSQYS